MSSIDERIVQMQFNNSQFEKGIKESLKSLDMIFTRWFARSIGWKQRNGCAII